MIPRLAHGVGAAALFGLVGPGCSPSWYAANADAEVSTLLDHDTEEVLGDRAEWVIQPETEPEAPAATPKERSAEKQEVDPRAMQVDLPTALKTAVRHNREYQDQRDALFLDGLATTRVDFDFGPQLRASVTPTFVDGTGRSSDTNVLGNFSASQLLPTGGTLFANSDVLTDDWGQGYSLTLSQPLLRRFGYENSHEVLTQTERSLVYRIRSFELFRQDFSIGVASAFFVLITEKRTVANEEANYREAVFDLDKAQAMARLGRNDEQDVFRARRREIEANDSYIAAKARYQSSIDAFKIEMGLPISTDIEIVDQDPPFRPVRLNLESAVNAAKHNRLDLMTLRDQIEDTKRRVRIAENNLLPDLDLNVTGGYDDLLGTGGDGAWSVGASITAEIPLQRLPERNIYSRALIAVDNAEREYSLQLDQLEVNIRDQLRQMDSLEQRILLQQEQITEEQRAVKVSEIRVAAGDLDNRDLLDARLSLVNAQNDLIRLQADHFVRSLRLMRDLGVLFVDDNGEWQ